MAVTQRALSSDIGKRSFDFVFELAVGHGHSGILAMVPYPCQINAIQMTSTYQANNPYLLLTIYRFIPGTGFTSIAFGSTFTIPVYGTSGMPLNGISLPSSSDSLKLMANDLINYYCHSPSASGVCDGLSGSIIVTPVQDKITYFGNLA